MSDLNHNHHLFLATTRHGPGPGGIFLAATADDGPASGENMATLYGTLALKNKKQRGLNSQKTQKTHVFVFCGKQ